MHLDIPIGVSINLRQLGGLGICRTVKLFNICNIKSGDHNSKALNVFTRSKSGVVSWTPTQAIYARPLCFCIRVIQRR
jgi:hypothetical protein